MSPSNTKIGVFDSGLGGLTVAMAIERHIPGISMVYLGDNARVPYGVRSPETVERYARSCARVLAERDIDLLVVACNTVSAVALPALRSQTSLPTIGVIEPGAGSALQASTSKAIAVLATEGTVGSQAYRKAIQERLPTAKVFEQAAPLLVPLVEEGWIEGEVPSLAVRRYLRRVSSQGDFDTLILGCTHYPHLKSVFQDEIQREALHAVLIDSAEATAAVVKDRLKKQGLLPSPQVANSPDPIQILVTDRPKSFDHVANTFLESCARPYQVSLVDLPIGLDNG